MIANCITGTRIVGATVLLFLEPFTKPFYIVYLLCGFSDAIDGLVARLTGTAGKFGAKLDSIADLLFYSSALLKQLPELWVRLPYWIWILVGATVVVRIACYTLAAVRTRQMAALHTYGNKASGLAVFLIPFALLLPRVTIPYCAVAALIAAAASVHELTIHLGREK